MKTILHKKSVAIPLLIVAVVAIIVLLLLPSLPQLQSAAQSYTKQHPAVARLVPKSFKPPDLSVPTTGNWLVIPEASLKMPINEGASIAVLDKDIGVWHETGTLQHNYVLAGHRLQYFRSVNQSLYHLNLLQPGNIGIFLVINGVDHQYKVETSMIVAPTDVAILQQTAKPLLTIYTCNDFENHSRLVMTAVPIPITPTDLQPKV
jgi:LPXTG-site transpeptidase (sortase) family protein